MDIGMDIGHGRHAATWWRFLEKNGVQHVRGKHAQNKRREEMEKLLSSQEFREMG